MRNLRTIGFRLTLWGTGITLAVCLLVCVVLYTGTWYSLHHEVDSFLEAEIHEFMGLVRQHEDNLPLAEQEIRTHLGSRSPSDLRFRVFDAGGQLLLTSDANDPVPPDFLIVPGEDRVPGRVLFGTLDLPGGDAPLRVCSMVATSAASPPCIAQASYSLARVESSLSLLRKAAGGSILVAAILAIIAGRILASKSLAPLHRMTSTAEHISGSRLSDRLPRTGNNDEFDRLAAVLNDLLGRVEQYVRRMQQFTADASHELRSPLAALRGSAEVALSRERSPEELRHVLEENIEHYDRLIRIAEDLLLLARLDSGEVVLRQEIMDLNRAAEDAVDLFLPLATEGGLSLAFTPGDPAMLMGDPGRLRQVIANLLDNAIKYTASPGSIRVSLVRANGEARVQVADTGIGIASEHLRRVFDRFYRVDRSRSRKGTTGAGLGLAICRSVVEAHAGTIHLDSLPGRGTTVTIQLPIRDAADADPDGR